MPALIALAGSQADADRFRRQRKKFKFTELQGELQRLTKEERDTRRQRSALNAARVELQVLPPRPTCPVQMQTMSQFACGQAAIPVVLARLKAFALSVFNLRQHTIRVLT